MKIIKIAFSFDYNFYRQAGVAISSLLDFDDDNVGYDIYCLCADDVKESEQNKLIEITKSKSRNSKIYFKTVGSIFNASYEVRGITTVAYFRLLLHRLLPDIDKIIYSDVDVIFKGNLTDVWKKELGDNLLGVVKCPLVNIDRNFEEYKKKYDYFKKYLHEVRGKYFNSGFLLMNLKEIRNSNLDNEWLEMTKKDYYFVDQDILNITCKGRVVYLPSKFNVLVNLVESPNYKELKNEQILSVKDVEDIHENPVVLHFAGGKPWDYKNSAHFNGWWDYVKNNTSFYDYFNNRSIDMENKRKLEQNNQNTAILSKQLKQDESELKQLKIRFS